MKILSFIALLLIPIAGQTQVTLNNPSFEDEPGDATIPMGWFACQQGTTPDILPGYWGVYDDPVDGDTYVGIITRDNGTYESIGQRTSAPLEKGFCYQFSIDLAHSNIYSGYNGPIKLRVWIGENKCDKDQLVFESEYIKHTEWKTYYVRFKAKEKAHYIILEAHYIEGEFSFKGNILMDNLSPLYFCDRT